MAMGSTLGFNSPIMGITYQTKQYNKLKEEYDEFIEKFKKIGDLQKGDKLARNEKQVYYIHTKDMYFLQLRRWWENQGRTFTFSYLDEDFSKFMKYLDKILASLDMTYDNRYIELAKSTRVLANNIMTGLYNLKTTYPQEEKLLCKIDSIILSIIDFKNSMNEKLETPNTSVSRYGRALSD